MNFLAIVIFISVKKFLIIFLPVECILDIPVHVESHFIFLKLPVNSNLACVEKN